MILDLIGKSDRNLLDRVAHLLAYEASLLHLGDDEIPSDKRLVRIECRIVTCRLIDHADKSCGFLHCQFRRSLGKEGLGCSLDSICIAAEEDGIHVHIHYLILCVASLELYSRNPLLEFDPDHLQDGNSRYPAAHILSRIKSLRELLGNGTSSSLAGISAEKGLDGNTSETLEVYAGMIVETHILCSDRSVDEVLRELVECDERPVLYMECGQDLTIFGNHLRGKLAVRILQFLEGRNVRKGPHQGNKTSHHDDRKREQYPEPFDDFLFYSVCHLSKSFKIFHHLLPIR